MTRQCADGQPPWADPWHSDLPPVQTHTRHKSITPSPPPPPAPGFWTIGTIIQAGLAYALLNDHGWCGPAQAAAHSCISALMLSCHINARPACALINDHGWCAHRAAAARLRAISLSGRPGSTLGPAPAASRVAPAPRASPRAATSTFRHPHPHPPPARRRILVVVSAVPLGERAQPSLCWHLNAAAASAIEK